MVRQGLTNADSSTATTSKTMPDSTAGPNTTASPGSQNDTDSAGIIRRSYEDQGLPKHIASFLMSAWRPGTHQQYRSYLQRWLSFCEQEQVDPVRPPVGPVLEFMHRLYSHGKSDSSGLAYSSLGTARSALSTIATIDNIPAGQHPLITKFMKAAFNQRPVLPKNNITWDVSLVLRHLKTLGPNETIHIRQLAKKLVVLMLLLSGQRGQTIHALDTQSMTLTNEGVTFIINVLLKTWRPGHHQSRVYFPSYPIDSRLCVVSALRTYISRTKFARQQETRLFLNIKPPHTPVHRDTIRRWTRDTLEDAGIDMSIFTPHSTRAASTSRAATKLPLDTILATAGWSQATTFQRFYNKPIEQSGDFADSILQSALDDN